MTTKACPWLAGAVLVAAVWLAGCPAGQSVRCRSLCQSVAECVDTQGPNDLIIDENECTTTCTSLERDPEGKSKVDAYAACLESAHTCDLRLECNVTRLAAP